MLNATETERQLDLRMPATLESIDEADDRLAAYLTAHHTHVDLFAIRILLRESLLNAVIHGSGKNPNIEVELKLDIAPDRLTMVVRDTGPGFNWRDHPRDFDVDGDGGRGLALMEIYADTVAFNDPGNEVTLTKKIESVPARSADGATTKSGKHHARN